MPDLSNSRHPVDAQSCPEWGDGPDGRSVLIASDERLPGLFAAWIADACDHPNRSVVRWVNDGGATCYKRFCRDCGTMVSEFLKHEDAQRGGYNLDLTRDAMASRSRGYYRERQEALDRIVNSAAERMQPVNRSSRGDYFRTAEWKAKRRLIMRRAANTCEGCLIVPADDVHHVTEEHFGNEFAFELLALCRDCHERFHNSRKSKAA